jgi:hypothetical protein
VSGREAWETFAMPPTISTSEVQQIKALIPGYVAKIVQVPRAIARSLWFLAFSLV